MRSNNVYTLTDLRTSQNALRISLTLRSSQEAQPEVNVRRFEDIDESQCRELIAQLLDPATTRQTRMYDILPSIQEFPLLLEIRIEEGNLLMASVGDTEFLEAILNVYEEMLHDNVCLFCDILSQKREGLTVLAMAIKSQNAQAIEALATLYAKLRNVYERNKDDFAFNAKYESLVNTHVNSQIWTEEEGTSTNCLEYAMLVDKKGNNAQLIDNTEAIYRILSREAYDLAMGAIIDNRTVRMPAIVPHMVGYVQNKHLDVRTARQVYAICPDYKAGSNDVVQEAAQARRKLYQYIKHDGRVDDVVDDIDLL